MSTILIVGSGASGVHLAQTLLERGRAVLMLDVGLERPAPALPKADFNGLKTRLDDPVAYFLGPSGEAVVFPTEGARYYGFPPSKDYVFASPPAFRAAASGFEPVISFAAGGLAEAWTGGVYPLNDGELVDFPFGFSTLAPHYATVVRRIGITATRDDLERYSPWFEDYQEPLETDPHSARLLERYARARPGLNKDLGFYLGRSRVAVLSRDLEDRNECNYLGRCLWGCPREALYAPSSTLKQLRRHPGFRYLPGLYVTHFTYDGDTVTGIAATAVADGTRHQFSADAYALAAGTLCSSKILLESIFQRTGRVLELGGLMDNRQMMIPFLNLGMLGQVVETHSYQFHQIALGITRGRSEEYVHGQISTLKAAAVHPVVQNLPFDLRSSLAIFRATHGALGVANVWLHDRRDARNVVTIRPRPNGEGTDLVIRYAADDDADRVAKTMRTVKRALWRLGCVVPPGMAKVLPHGASIHYAGTVPMSREHREFTCTPDCRSHDFSNLYFADGVSFPFLPAKNLTFTLMANAIRIGDALPN